MASCKRGALFLITILMTMLCFSFAQSETPASLLTPLNEELLKMPDNPIFEDGKYEEYVITWDMPENVFSYWIGIVSEVIVDQNIYLTTLSGGWFGNGYINSGDSVIYAENMPFQSILLDAQATSIDIAAYINKAMNASYLNPYIVMAIIPQEGNEVKKIQAMIQLSPEVEAYRESHRQEVMEFDWLTQAVNTPKEWQRVVQSFEGTGQSFTIDGFVIIPQSGLGAAVDLDQNLILLTAVVDGRVVQEDELLKKIADRMLTIFSKCAHNEAIRSEDIAKYGSILDTFDVRIILATDENANIDTWLMDCIIPKGSRAETEMPTQAVVLRDTDVTSTDHFDSNHSAGAKVIITSTSAVNLRAKGNSDSKIVGKAQPGDTFPCTGTASSGWYEIQLPDGQTAYISPKMATYEE